MKAFNEALDKGLPENEASMMAWAAVKRAGYTKNSEGKWSKSMDFETTIEMGEDADAFSLTVPLTKVNTKKRTVEGFATLNNVDEVGDLVDPEASMEAFAKWYGNIREMHQKKAVGKAIDFYPQEYVDEETGETYEGIWVKARISKGAEDTWQKVLDGTLCAFSIGGATLEKQREMAKDLDGNTRQVWRIMKYRLTELSLVDSPANRLATIALAKSIDGGDGINFSEELDDLGDADEFAKLEFGEADSSSSEKLSKEESVKEKLDNLGEEAQEIQNVIGQLEAWREVAMGRGNDDLVIWITDILSRVRYKLNDAVYEVAYPLAQQIAQAQLEALATFSKDYNTNKEDSMSDETKDEATSEDTELQKDEESAISNVEGFSAEDTGLLRKFVDFIKSDDSAKAESTEEGESMDTEELGKAIDEKVSATAEELSKSVDAKFTQVGESLSKIADLMEKVATTESVESVKKGLDESVTALAERVEALENSGAVKKSGDDAGATGEEIQKSEDGGLWAESILPGFLTNR